MVLYLAGLLEHTPSASSSPVVDYFGDRHWVYFFYAYYLAHVYVYHDECFAYW